MIRFQPKNLKSVILNNSNLKIIIFTWDHFIHFVTTEDIKETLRQIVSNNNMFKQLHNEHE